ncbi:MAG: FadR/GntR family transcriptional regulator [Thermodesulfobacteriota bacterium]
MTIRRHETASLATPLKKGSVVVEIIDRIKRALLNGEIGPGDFLPSETELTRSLGVGKSSVREAMKMLQAMGIVEVRQGQGTMIRETPGNDYLDSMAFHLLLTRKLSRDVLELRRMFEPAYTLMAMRQATEEDVARIGAAVERLERAIRRGSQQAEDDMAFHQAILDATHNPLVVRIGETLMQLYEASIGTSMKLIPDIALADHKAIYEAFKARDEAAVREAIERSSERWKACLEYASGEEGKGKGGEN